MPNVHDLVNRFNTAGKEAPAQLTTWAQIGDIITDADKGTRVRDAFKGGSAEIVYLPAGMTLYKFNDYSSLQSADDARLHKPISPWWTAYHPFRHDPGWEAKKRIAKHFGVSIREWGRVTSAVKENWNSLSWLAVIRLKVRTVAAFGGFAHMARIDPNAASKAKAGEGRGKTMNLPGGGTQFYIPNLDARNVFARFESLANL